MMVQRSLYLCASYGIYGHKGPSFLQVVPSKLNGLPSTCLRPRGTGVQAPYRVGSSRGSHGGAESLESLARELKQPYSMRRRRRSPQLLLPIPTFYQMMDIMQ